MTRDSATFRAYFGFDANFYDPAGDAHNFNGDDAFEVFENGTVVDIYGLIDTDGTGEPWEYTLGWVHRKPGTRPDGSTFVLDNWEFSGFNVFVDSLNNAASPIPYPVGECESVNTQQVDRSNHILVYPNPASDFLQIESDILIEKITVSNLLWQTVLSMNNVGYNANIDMRKIPNNVYLLQFVAGNQSWSQKVVVSR